MPPSQTRGLGSTTMDCRIKQTKTWKTLVTFFLRFRSGRVRWALECGTAGLSWSKRCGDTTPNCQSLRHEPAGGPGLWRTPKGYLQSRCSQTWRVIPTERCGMGAVTSRVEGLNHVAWKMSRGGLLEETRTEICICRSEGLGESRERASRERVDPRVL